MAFVETMSAPKIYIAFRSRAINFTIIKFTYNVAQICPRISVVNYLDIVVLSLDIGTLL